MSWLRPPSNRALILAVIAGTLLRLAAAFATPVFPLIANTWDTTYYQETATAIARGEGYAYQGKPTAFFPPGFPAALGALYAVTGDSPRAGQLLNVVFSLALLALMGLTARHLAGSAAARWTVLVLAVEPSQIVMPAFLMSEVLCGALIALVAFAAVRWAASRGLGWTVLAAAAGTAAGLTRGNAFLLVPALGFAAARAARLPLRSLLVPALATALVGGVALGAWGLRNESRLGSPVLVSTNVGNNLLVGNNPNARGGREEPPEPIPQTGDEIRDEEIAMARARAYIAGHPLRFAAMMPLKAARLWAFGPAITYRAELGEKWGRLAALIAVGAAQIAHLALLVGAAWALLAAGRFSGARRGPSVLLLTVAAVWTASFLPFFGGSRYLLPIQAFLVLAVAAALAERAPATDSAA